MAKLSPEFAFAKDMPVKTRQVWIFILAAAGFAVQVAASVIIGWGIILAAALLGITKTESNEPEVVGVASWQNVTMDEYNKAASLLSEKDKLTDRTSAFSVGDGNGCLLLVAAIFGIGIVAAFLYSVVDNGSVAPDPILSGGSVSVIFTIDALTMLLPFWLFGGAKTWEPPYFETRMQQLDAIYHVGALDPQLDFQPSFLIAPAEEGSVPLDCKFMVQIKDADKNFMGIQVQVSFNDVKGVKYPYTYCVLITKPEFQLMKRALQVVEMPSDGGFLKSLFADANETREAKYYRYNKALVELNEENDVEIAVVRQYTGGTGYTTNLSEAQAVYVSALNLAKEILRV